jgi:LysR family hca operon transcriptional activator
MELRYLRYFAAVVVNKNFSRAAAALFITQPALSRQIRALEEELGVKLFLRAQNNVSLTSAGERFYEDAVEIIELCNRAIERAKRRQRETPLRIGYLPSLTYGVLPKVLSRFKLEHKSSTPELYDLTALEIERRSQEGSLDIAIVTKGSEQRVQSFNWNELRHLSPRLIMQRQHPLAKLEQIPPKKLVNQPLHGLGSDSFPDYITRLREILKPFGVCPTFASLSADSVASIFANIEAEGGAAVLSEGHATTMPRSLISRPFFPPLHPVVVIVGLPALKPRQSAETFVRLLHEAAVDDRCSRHS